MFSTHGSGSEHRKKWCLDVSVASYTQLNPNVTESVSIMCGFRVSYVSPNLTIGSL